MDEANFVFEELQGMQTLIMQQQLHLKGLVNTYCLMSQMKGPLDEQIQNSDILVSLARRVFKVE